MEKLVLRIDFEKKNYVKICLIHSASFPAQRTISEDSFTFVTHVQLTVFKIRLKRSVVDRTDIR